jgi:hypothetical protein
VAAKAIAFSSPARPVRVESVDPLGRRTVGERVWDREKETVLDDRDGPPCEGSRCVPVAVPIEKNPDYRPGREDFVRSTGSGT